MNDFYIHKIRIFLIPLPHTDGVAPSRMASVYASVNLPLHHKVQKFSSAPTHPGGPGKRAVNGCVWWCATHGHT